MEIEVDDTEKDNEVGGHAGDLAIMLARLLSVRTWTRAAIL